MENIIGRRVLVTGSQSMLGIQVMSLLATYKAIPYGVPHEICDLMDERKTFEYFNAIKPDYIIHCAGFNGGIFYNEKYPSDIYNITTTIGSNVLNTAKKLNVDKVVSVATSCAYPVNEILEEKDFLNGEPHDSVQCHAYAKRHLFVYGKQLHKQYGLKHICVVFNNMYGPRDSFDANKTKFIGALVRKICDGKFDNTESIELWGTGKPLREVIFSRDAAKGLIESLIKYDNYSSVLNIGNGEEKTVLEYAEKIKEICNYNGKIIVNPSKPDGQMKKLLSNRRMRQYNIDVDFTTLESGLKQTINYYENI